MIDFDIETDAVLYAAGLSMASRVNAMPVKCVGAASLPTSGKISQPYTETASGEKGKRSVT